MRKQYVAAGLWVLLAGVVWAQESITPGTFDVSDRAGRLLGTIANSFLLDATYTGRTPAGASPADNESNTNAALSRVGVFPFIFDGATWDRWTGAVTAPTLVQEATYTGRTPAGASPADNESNTNTALSRIGGFQFLFDGSTWDRWPGDSANGAKVQNVTAANFNNRPDTSGATAAAVPARADYIGGISGANLTGIPVCDTTAYAQRTLASTLELIALTASNKIRVCSIALNGSTSATASDLSLVTGTGSNCATGLATLLGPLKGPASCTTAACYYGLGSGMGGALEVPTGNALCTTNSAAGTWNVTVTYTKVVP